MTEIAREEGDHELLVGGRRWLASNEGQWCAGHSKRVKEGRSVVWYCCVR